MAKAPRPSIQCSGYLTSSLEPKCRTKMINNVVRVIKQHITAEPQLDFAAIAVSGVSGIVVGSIVASKLRKRLIVVRKHDDTSTHSYFHVEGLQVDISRTGKIVNNDYLILDDLIDTGTTAKYIIGSIAMCIKQHSMFPMPAAQCVGIVLYEEHKKAHASKNADDRTMRPRLMADGWDAYKERLRIRLDQKNMPYDVIQDLIPSEIAVWS